MVERVENLYFNYMKTLYLVRHAKSSWSLDQVDDRDRPLKGRGIRDAHLVSTYIEELLPQNAHFKMFSSPATRAVHTALIFAKNFQVPAAEVKMIDELYHAGVQTLRSHIARTADHIDTAIYFAHNPGITDFVNDTTDAHISNVPTTGLVCLRFDVGSWREIGPGAELITFEYPKRLKTKE